MNKNFYVVEHHKKKLTRPSLQFLEIYKFFYNFYKISAFFPNKKKKEIEVSEGARAHVEPRGPRGAQRMADEEGAPGEELEAAVVRAKRPHLIRKF